MGQRKTKSQPKWPNGNINKKRGENRKKREEKIAKKARKSHLASNLKVKEPQIKGRKIVKKKKKSHERKRHLTS